MDNNPVALNDVLGLSADGGGQDANKNSGKEGRRCDPRGRTGGTCEHGETEPHTIHENHGKLGALLNSAGRFALDLAKGLQATRGKKLNEASKQLFKIENTAVTLSNYENSTGGGWKPLTKDALSSLVKSFPGCPKFDNDGAWQNYLGNRFEDQVWNYFIKSTPPEFNLRRTLINEKYDTDFNRKTRPDFIADAFHPNGEKLKKAVFYEVKAINGKKSCLYKSTNTYQIAAQISALKKLHYYNKTQVVPAFVIITTYGVKVSGIFKTECRASGINFTHWEAWYRSTSDGFELELRSPETK